MENVLELDNTQYHENIPAPARDPAVIAAEINAIKVHTCGVVALSVFEIGKRLCEAKEIVGHGQWAEWLHDNVSYSEVTAQRLMRCHREMSGEAQELEEGEPNVFEGLSFSQMVSLFPLPPDKRVEVARENAIQGMSTREVQGLVEREKRALADAANAKEMANRAQDEAKEAMTAKQLAETELANARRDSAEKAKEMNELREKNAALVNDLGKMRVKMNKLKVPKAKEVPPSEETLAKIREDLAKEYVLKADPDVQGITFNLGDLSERVHKIDEQLARIKERDAEAEAKLRDKLKNALAQIFSTIDWTPWAQGGEEVAL